MIDRTEEYKSKRKKRRIRRVIVALFFIACATLLSWFFESQSTTTVVLTTHAEIDSNTGIDGPGLSQLGLERANSLQEIIESIDVVAGVDAVYATRPRLRATRETAEPVAMSLNLKTNEGLNARQRSVPRPRA